MKKSLDCLLVSFLLLGDQKPTYKYYFLKTVNNFKANLTGMFIYRKYVFVLIRKLHKPQNLTQNPKGNEKKMFMRNCKHD